MDPEKYLRDKLKLGAGATCRYPGRSIILLRNQRSTRQVKNQHQNCSYLESLGFVMKNVGPCFYKKVHRL